ncbi:MAG: leucine-rich repeat domain-containing protein [Acutalibacteraceae bacterium]
MKKLLAIGVLVTMLASLTACGNSTTSDSTKNSSTTVSSSSTVNKTESSSEKSNPNTVVDNSKNAEQIIANAKLQYPSANDEYEYNVYDTYIEITKYIGSDTDVTIPSKIDNLPVLVVGDGQEAVLDNNHNPTSVKFSSGIAIISDNAFESSIGRRLNLTSISLPDTLLKIGEHAFSNCDSLKSLTLPDGLHEIGYAAFYSTFYTDSVDLIIPATVNYIGLSSFNNCPALKSVTIYNPNAIIEYHANESLGATAFSSKYPDKIVIYGYAGSTAAEYCAEHDSYTFKLIKE